MDYQEKRFFLAAFDNVNLAVSSFQVQKPKAVLLYVHGMEDHQKREEKAVPFFTQAGYSVYTYDHRGEGMTAVSMENCGFFAPTDGWLTVTKDMNCVVNLIRKENPDLPLFLFAHSMGALIARTFMMLFPNSVEGIIFSGPPHTEKLSARFGYHAFNWAVRRYGYKKKAEWVEHAINRQYNKKFRPARTPYDWISSDPAMVDRFIADPFCGISGTISFYRDLLWGFIFTGKKKNIAKISPDLPILLLTGSDDPVSHYGKVVKKFYRLYKKIGVKDVEMKIYEKGRHELMNEYFYLDFFTDILNWCEARRQRAVSEGA